MSDKKDRKDFYIERKSQFFVFAAPFLLLFDEWLLYILLVALQTCLITFIPIVRQFFYENRKMLVTILLLNAVSIICYFLDEYIGGWSKFLFFVVFLICTFSFAKAQELNLESSGA